MQSDAEDRDCHTVIIPHVSNAGSRKKPAAAQTLVASVIGEDASCFILLCANVTFQMPKTRPGLC